MAGIGPTPFSTLSSSIVFVNEEREQNAKTNLERMIVSLNAVATNSGSVALLNTLFETESALFNDVVIDCVVKIGTMKNVNVLDLYQLGPFVSTPFISHIITNNTPTNFVTQTGLLNPYLAGVAQIRNVDVTVLKNSVLSLLGMNLELANPNKNYLYNRISATVKTSYQPNQRVAFTNTRDVESVLQNNIINAIGSAQEYVFNYVQHSSRLALPCDSTLYTNIIRSLVALQDTVIDENTKLNIEVKPFLTFERLKIK